MESSFAYCQAKKDNFCTCCWVLQSIQKEAEKVLDLVKIPWLTVYWCSKLKKYLNFAEDNKPVNCEVQNKMGVAVSKSDKYLLASIHTKKIL